MTIIIASTPGPRGEPGQNGSDGAPGQQGPIGPQGVPGAGAKWQTGQSYTGLVADRGKVMTSAAVFAAANARSIHTARTDITQIGVAVAGWYVDDSGAEHHAGADSTVKLGIEYPLGGMVTPLKFGGAASGMLYDGATLFSDLATIAIPNGAQFAVRQYWTTGSGGNIIYSGGANGMNINTTLGDCFEYGSSLTDRSGTAGSFTSTATQYYKPLAIFGPTDQPSYVFVGDSRVEGWEDDAADNTYIGMFERAFATSAAFMNLAKGGETISNVTTGNEFALRGALVERFATHVMCNYGVNDISAGTSNGPITAQLAALRRQFPGKYFYQTLIDTETTSTDNWATTTNQTPKTGMTTIRKYVNSWLRSNAGGTGLYDGVFDTTTVTESAVNSGLWVPSFTADGIHPTPAGYAAIASSGVIHVV